MKSSSFITFLKCKEFLLPYESWHLANDCSSPFFVTVTMSSVCSICHNQEAKAFVTSAVNNCFDVLEYFFKAIRHFVQLVVVCIPPTNCFFKCHCTTTYYVNFKYLSPYTVRTRSIFRIFLSCGYYFLFSYYFLRSYTHKILSTITYA